MSDGQVIEILNRIFSQALRMTFFLNAIMDLTSF